MMLALKDKLINKCIKCEITESLTGKYELYLECEKNNGYIEALQVGAIIVADLKNEKDKFRIYEIDKNESNIVKVFAHHISYDLNKLVGIIPSGSYDIVTAVNLIKNADDYAPEIKGYNFEVDYLLKQESVQHDFGNDELTYIKSYIQDEADSISSLWGCEVKYRNQNVYFLKARGKLRDLKNPIIITQGKNLQSYSQSIDDENSYTEVLPYYTMQDEADIIGDVYHITKGIVPTKTLLLKANERFTDTIPTIAELNGYAQQYVRNNKILQVNKSIELTYYQQDEEIQDVEIGDTIPVDIEGVEEEIRCVETVWDVLRQRYDRITLSQNKETISHSINSAVNLSYFATTNDIEYRLKHKINEVYKSNTMSMCEGTVAGGGRVLAFFIPYYRACGTSWEVTDLTISTRLYEGVVGYVRSGTNGSTYSQISGLQILNNGSAVRNNEVESFEITATEQTGLRVRLQFVYPIAVNNNDPTPTKNNTSMLVQVGAIKARRIS